MRLSLRVVPLLIVAASLVPVFMTPTTGKTTPLYATRTGLACQNCHFDPNGGGPRNAFGFAYARTAIPRMPRRTARSGPGPHQQSERAAPALLRRQLAAHGASPTTRDPPDGVDRFGFIQMETQLHMAFQPHSRLTLVYTSDGFGTQNNPFGGGARVNREAWGMLGLGANHYLRVGIFRVPFGLRMDDHTVATRNAYTEFQSNPNDPRSKVLPYDPRIGDEGIELGAQKGEFQGRLAYADGGSFIFASSPQAHAQALSGKIAYVDAKYQVGVSGYDNWLPATTAGGRVRASRWGTYVVTHPGRVSLIGEVVAGTDELSPVAAGAPESKQNRMGYFVEGDYQMNRATNFRLRYDHMDGGGVNEAASDQASLNRYAVEGEVVPVPFCELRWTLRLIDPVADKDPTGTVDRDTEKQAYIQFHFSYNFRLASWSLCGSPFVHGSWRRKREGLPTRFPLFPPHRLACALRFHAPAPAIVPHENPLRHRASRANPGCTGPTPPAGLAPQEPRRLLLDAHGAGVARPGGLRRRPRERGAVGGREAQGASGTRSRKRSFWRPTRTVGRDAACFRSWSMRSGVSGMREAIAITSTWGAAPPSSMPASRREAANDGPCFHSASSITRQPPAGGWPSMRSAFSISAESLGSQSRASGPRAA
jgi:hypothetical protein